MLAIMDAPADHTPTNVEYTGKSADDSVIGKNLQSHKKVMSVRSAKNLISNILGGKDQETIKQTSDAAIIKGGQKTPGEAAFTQAELGILNQAMTTSPKFVKQSLQATINQHRKNPKPPVQKKPSVQKEPSVQKKPSVQKNASVKKNASGNGKLKLCMILTPDQIAERKRYASNVYHQVKKAVMAKTGNAAEAIEQAQLAHKEAAAFFIQFCKDQAPDLS